MSFYLTTPIYYVNSTPHIGHAYTTITADIGPGDVQGYEVLATVTNQQPEHRNDTYLETIVTAHVDTAPSTMNGSGLG